VKIKQKITYRLSCVSALKVEDSTKSDLHPLKHSVFLEQGQGWKCLCRRQHVKLEEYGFCVQATMD